MKTENYLWCCVLLLSPSAASASNIVEKLDLTGHWVGYASLAIFFLAYLVVMLEEFTHMRKSKPVMLAAGIIWALIAWIYQAHGFNHTVEEAVRHNLLE